MSARTLESSIDRRFVLMACISPLQSDRSQMWVRLRVAACSRAALIANASAIRGEATCSWKRQPLAISVED